MIKLDLDKKSVKTITSKLKAMSGKLQRKAIRSSIDPEAKKIAAQFKAVSPISKRKHKNKYRKRAGTGFLKSSFSVRNSGKGDTVGRKIITRAVGYHIHMSSAGTGRTAGSKGKHRWGAVTGSKRYDKIWNARQRGTVSRITTTLANELKRL